MRTKERQPINVVQAGDLVRYKLGDHFSYGVVASATVLETMGTLRRSTEVRAYWRTLDTGYNGRPAVGFMPLLKDTVVEVMREDGLFVIADEMELD